MSYTEFVSWVKYRRKRGSLNIGMRVEYSIALLATLYANSKSKEKYNIHDFAPYHDEPEISLDRAMEDWT